MVKSYTESKSDGDPPKRPEFVWDEISKLNELSDFINEGKRYEETFEEPLNQASGRLRTELARILDRS